MIKISISMMFVLILLFNFAKIKVIIYMALPINITDLLNKQKIESNRIEFKKNSTSPKAAPPASPPFRAN